MKELVSVVITTYGRTSSLKRAIKSVCNQTYENLEILYKGEDKLYIPVEKIELISKYSGREGVTPKINGLGSLEWRKNKQRIINKVRDIADKLIKLNKSKKDDEVNRISKILYAQARLIEGLPIDNPTEISNLICEELSK